MYVQCASTVFLRKGKRKPKENLHTTYLHELQELKKKQGADYSFVLIK